MRSDTQRNVSFANAFGNVEPVRKTINGLNIMVDPRMELLEAVQFMSGYNDRTYLLTNEQFSYKNDMSEYFRNFRSHAAVKYFDTLSSKYNFTYDAPPAATLYVTAQYDETGNFGFSEYLINRTGIDKLDKFARYLLQFSADTDFSRFYNEHMDFYEEVVERTAAVMEDDLIGDIENYYGIKQNSYNIILVPMFHPGGFASRLENKDGSFDIYSIQGPLGADGDIPVFGTAGSFGDLVYHEFGHSFVNPLTEKYRDEVNKHQKLYEPIADKMGSGSNAYGSWETCVNEHIVRAVTARLLLTHEGGEIYLKTLDQERAKGFYYINDICKKLEEFEANREKFGSFEEFYPELENVLKNLSEREPGDGC